ncbi:lipoprotein LpqH [Mycobacterium kubicae]|nr:lipoprotein LpqH [Mycobacterium kubicae]
MVVTIPMTNHVTTALSAAALVLGLSACSGHAVSKPAAADITIEGHKHTITSGIECETESANPNATPPQSGSRTTHITASDGAAEELLSLSDTTPLGVNGFSVTVTVDADVYRIPYQPLESSSKVQATKAGKSYTVTGSGKGSEPNVTGMRDLHFEVRVTCP